MQIMFFTRRQKSPQMLYVQFKKQLWTFGPVFAWRKGIQYMKITFFCAQPSQFIEHVGSLTL